MRVLLCSMVLLIHFVGQASESTIRTEASEGSTSDYSEPTIFDTDMDDFKSFVSVSSEPTIFDPDMEEPYQSEEKRNYFAASLLYERFIYQTKKILGIKTFWITKIIGEYLHRKKYRTFLYLGSLPLLGQNGDIPQEIIDLKISAVLSATRIFELSSPVFWLSPIPPQKWATAGVTQKIMELDDLLAYQPHEIEDAVSFISSQLKSGNVLVHCKAGRGRSASLVVAYLMKSRDLNFDEAYLYLKSIREQVNLNEIQELSVRDWANKYLAIDNHR